MICTRAPRQKHTNKHKRTIAENLCRNNCDNNGKLLWWTLTSIVQPKAHANQYEQVPSFSIFNQNQNHNQTSPFFTHMTNMEPNLPTTKINTKTTLKGLPTNIGTYLDPFSCDNKELKAVLTQLSNMDSNHEKYSLLIWSVPKI